MARCFAVLFLFSSLFLTSCQWKKSKQASILLIGVESLGFDQLNCSAPKKARVSGFETLCEEAVRFTHAYTPSVLSQAALASILTALHPHENGVWHNGPKFLSGRYETAGEIAIKKGYHTAFFSGGPPIWSFSGLNQGFERFVDHFAVRAGGLYRPAKENFDFFLGWAMQPARRRPFFAVVYLPDLQFEDVGTVSDLGDLRPRGYDSQLAEVDESLGQLIERMKEEKIWDDTHVFFFGLNGIENVQKPLEVRGVDLSSTNTEVALLVKPARGQRDLGLNWKIDRNVSLVDVGATVFDLLGEPPPAGKAGRPEVVSLKNVLHEPTADWDKKRIILTESSWPQWLGFGETRFSARIEHLLFIYDRVTKIYNTFVDHLESASIPEDEPSVKAAAERIAGFFLRSEFEPWEGLPASLFDKWYIGSKIWHPQGLSPDLILALQGLAERRPWDHEVLSWVAEISVLQGRWRELEELAERTQNLTWKYFALRAQGKPRPPRPSGCLSLLEDLDKPVDEPGPKVCSSESFVKLVQWLSRRKTEGRHKYRANFVRDFRMQKLDREILRANYRNQLTWNVDYSRLYRMTLSQLTLALPEFEAERNEVEKELNIVTFQE